MISDGTYITIQGWMRTELKLSGNELIVYAIIYGFSQNKQGEFTGSAQYLADWVGCTRRTVMTILNKLVENNFISKTEIILNNNEKRVSYQAERGCEKTSQGVKNFHRGCEKISQGGVKNFHRGCEKISHNININNNTNNNNRDINTHDAGAREESAEAVENFTTLEAGPLPENQNGRAEAATILCGPNKNVKLTPAQLEELEKRIPNQLTRYIHRLSRYKVGRDNAAMMDDFQWLLGWISEDHADRKERELEAIRQAEAEEDRRELEELQARILKRKGRADLCG